MFTNEFEKEAGTISKSLKKVRMPKHKMVEKMLRKPEFKGDLDHFLTHRALMNQVHKRKMSKK